MARECTINRNGGAVSVILTATNGLVAGSDFKIIVVGQSTVLETWKMQTDQTGTTTYAIQLAPSQLDQKGMTWEVLLCSQIPGADSGNLLIEILQDGTVRPCTPPASWTQSNVPQCSAAQAQPKVGGLIFKAV